MGLVAGGQADPSAGNDPAKSIVPSPEDVAKRATAGLPRRIATFVLTALSLLSWITLPINFLSRLADIGAAVALYRSLYASLPGLLRTGADLVVTTLEPLILVWRRLIAPLHDLLATLAPDLPVYVTDALIIFTLCLPPLVQGYLAAQQADGALRSAAGYWQRRPQSGREGVVITGYGDLLEKGEAPQLWAFVKGADAVENDRRAKRPPRASAEAFDEVDRLEAEQPDYTDTAKKFERVRQMLRRYNRALSARASSRWLLGFAVLLALVLAVFYVLEATGFGR